MWCEFYRQHDLSILPVAPCLLLSKCSYHSSEFMLSVTLLLLFSRFFNDLSVFQKLVALVAFIPTLNGDANILRVRNSLHSLSYHILTYKTKKFMIILNWIKNLWSLGLNSVRVYENYSQQLICRQKPSSEYRFNAGAPSETLYQHQPSTETSTSRSLGVHYVYLNLLTAGPDYIRVFIFLFTY